MANNQNSNNLSNNPQFSEAQLEQLRELLNLNSEEGSKPTKKGFGLPFWENFPKRKSKSKNSTAQTYPKAKAPPRVEEDLEIAEYDAMYLMQDFEAECLKQDLELEEIALEIDSLIQARESMEAARYQNLGYFAQVDKTLDTILDW